jgi:hypothetical protein
VLLTPIRIPREERVDLAGMSTNIKYGAAALLLLIQYGCWRGIGSRNVEPQKLSKDEALFEQFSFLLERSIRFDYANPRFRYEVQRFIDTCTVKRDYLEKRINPFKLYDTLPIQLKPYLFNSIQSEVIICVLNREKDLKGAPVDHVHFVLGRKEDGKWNFRLKQGYENTYGYEGGHPVLPEVEISFKILRDLIDQGYMPVDEIRINDDFFLKDW